VVGNQIIGPQGSLFYFENGISYVTANTFSYNGFVSRETYKNLTVEQKRKYPDADFPFDDYEFEYA